MEGSIMTQRWSQRETVYKTFPHSLQKAVLSKPRQPYLSWELQANENFAEWLTCLWGGLPFFLVTFSEERESQMRSLLYICGLSYTSLTHWLDEMGSKWMDTIEGFFVLLLQISNSLLVLNFLWKNGHSFSKEVSTMFQNVLKFTKISKFAIKNPGWHVISKNLPGADMLNGYIIYI